MKNEGYLLVDHRSSPGLSETEALKFGYHPSQVKEGAVFEASTVQCNHCGCSVVLNPLRKRERAHCWKCSRYICDVCNAATQEPGYIHVGYFQRAEQQLEAAYKKEQLING